MQRPLLKILRFDKQKFNPIHIFEQLRLEEALFRSDEQKLEILKKFSISTKDEVPKLNKEYNFSDIRIRVKLFRDQLLRRGYKEQLLEIGVSIDENENPKVGSSLTN